MSAPPIFTDHVIPKKSSTKKKKHMKYISQDDMLNKKPARSNEALKHQGSSNKERTQVLDEIDHYFSAPECDFFNDPKLRKRCVVVIEKSEAIREYERQHIAFINDLLERQREMIKERALKKQKEREKLRLEMLAAEEAKKSCSVLAKGFEPENRREQAMQSNEKSGSISEVNNCTLENEEAILSEEQLQLQLQPQAPKGMNISNTMVGDVVENDGKEMPSNKQLNEPSEKASGKDKSHPLPKQKEKLTQGVPNTVGEPLQPLEYHIEANREKKRSLKAKNKKNKERNPETIESLNKNISITPVDVRNENEEHTVENENIKKISKKPKHLSEINSRRKKHLRTKSTTQNEDKRQSEPIAFAEGALLNGYTSTKSIHNADRDYDKQREQNNCAEAKIKYGKAAKGIHNEPGPQNCAGMLEDVELSVLSGKGFMDTSICSESQESAPSKTTAELTTELELLTSLPDFLPPDSLDASSNHLGNVVCLADQSSVGNEDLPVAESLASLLAGEINGSQRSGGSNVKQNGDTVDPDLDTLISLSLTSPESIEKILEEAAENVQLGIMIESTAPADVPQATNQSECNQIINDTAVLLELNDLVNMHQQQSENAIERIPEPRQRVPEFGKITDGQKVCLNNENGVESYNSEDPLNEELARTLSKSNKTPKIKTQRNILTELLPKESEKCVDSDRGHLSEKGKKREKESLEEAAKRRLVENVTPPPKENNECYENPSLQLPPSTTSLNVLNENCKGDTVRPCFLESYPATPMLSVANVERLMGLNWFVDKQSKTNKSQEETSNVATFTEEPVQLLNTSNTSNTSTPPLTTKSLKIRVKRTNYDKHLAEWKIESQALWTAQQSYQRAASPKRKSPLPRKSCLKSSTDREDTTRVVRKVRFDESCEKDDKQVRRIASPNSELLKEEEAFPKPEFKTTPNKAFKFEEPKKRKKESRKLNENTLKAADTILLFNTNGFQNTKSNEFAFETLSDRIKRKSAEKKRLQEERNSLKNAKKEKGNKNAILVSTTTPIVLESCTVTNPTAIPTCAANTTEKIAGESIATPCLNVVVENTEKTEKITKLSKNVINQTIEPVVIFSQKRKKPKKPSTQQLNVKKLSAAVEGNNGGGGVINDTQIGREVNAVVSGKGQGGNNNADVCNVGQFSNELLPISAVNASNATMRDDYIRIEATATVPANLFNEESRDVPTPIPTHLLTGLPKSVNPPLVTSDHEVSSTQETFFEDTRCHNRATSINSDSSQICFPRQNVLQSTNKNTTTNCDKNNFNKNPDIIDDNISVKEMGAPLLLQNNQVDTTHHVLENHTGARKRSRKSSIYIGDIPPQKDVVLDKSKQSGLTKNAKRRKSVYMENIHESSPAAVTVNNGVGGKVNVTGCSSGGTSPSTTTFTEYLPPPVQARKRNLQNGKEHPVSKKKKRKTTLPVTIPVGTISNFDCQNPTPPHINQVPSHNTDAAYYQYHNDSLFSNNDHHQSQHYRNNVKRSERDNLPTEQKIPALSSDINRTAAVQQIFHNEIITNNVPSMTLTGQVTDDHGKCRSGSSIKNKTNIYQMKHHQHNNSKFSSSSSSAAVAAAIQAPLPPPPPLFISSECGTVRVKPHTPCDNVPNKKKHSKLLHKTTTLATTTNHSSLLVLPNKNNNNNCDSLQMRLAKCVLDDGGGGGGNGSGGGMISNHIKQQYTKSSMGPMDHQSRKKHKIN